MKRLSALLAALGMAALLAQAQSIYLTPDVPTRIGGGPITLLQYQIYRYDAGVYTTVLSVPGQPFIDGIHKLDAGGEWLISVEAPNNIAGLLGATAEPRDIIRYDGVGGYTFYFCPSQSPGLGIPAGVNLDAVYLEGSDTGDLIVSFDVPVELPPGSGTYFGPAYLVRFERTGAGCGAGAWMLSGANPVLATIPPSGIDMIGADEDAGSFVFSLDIPAALAPTTDPSPPFFTRDEVVSWDGATYGQHLALAGWPAGSEVNALSLVAAPGRVPPTIRLAKLGTDIVISWAASCPDGAEDYAIYEGTIGTWYSHTMKDCSSAAPLPLLEEQITPAVGNDYYLVVPLNSTVEGSYGRCSAGLCLGGNERPNASMAGGVQCVATQVILPCP